MYFTALKISSKSHPDILGANPKVLKSNGNPLLYWLYCGVYLRLRGAFCADEPEFEDELDSEASKIGKKLEIKPQLLTVKNSGNTRLDVHWIGWFSKLVVVYLIWLFWLPRLTVYLLECFGMSIAHVKTQRIGSNTRWVGKLRSACFTNCLAFFHIKIIEIFTAWGHHPVSETIKIRRNHNYYTENKHFYCGR